MLRRPADAVAVPSVRVQIEHLDGHKVQIGTKGVTRPGEVRWFQGEGMPQFEKVGRLRNGE